MTKGGVGNECSADMKGAMDSSVKAGAAVSAVKGLAASKLKGGDGTGAELKSGGKMK